MRYEIYIRQQNKPDPFYLSAMEEYGKRLGSDCRMKYRFIRKDREWLKLLSACRTSDDVILAVMPGKAEVTSEEFAGWISRWEREAVKKVIFLVGAPEGEDGESLPEEDALRPFHLSCFTMPEGMSAMILLEQIYRGYRILHHQPYHK